MKIVLDFTASPHYRITVLFAILLFPVLMLAQDTEQTPYNPCLPAFTLPAHCIDGTRSCESYSQYPCSNGYCWSSGVTADNQGIPPSGLVANKVIEISGVYTITQSVKFSNCQFKMRGGSRINISPVGSALKKVTFENCSFFGCNEMWYGIVINTASVTSLNFNFSGSNVEDAYIGLTLDELHSSYSILTNTFRNNYIGIGNLQKNGSILNASIIGNTFFQSANLAAQTLLVSNYPTVMMSDYPNSHAGIEYTSVSSTVGALAAATLVNLFTCLENGIVSTNSNLVSTNNTFQDLGKDGIRVTDGTISINNCTFQLDGQTAVSSNGANLTVQSSLFTGNWQEGINSVNNTNGEIIMISGNHFFIATTRWTRGIFLDRPQSNAVTNANISRNYFTVNSCSAFGFTGIYVVDSVDDTGFSTIQSNEITVNYAGGPIIGIQVSLGNSDNFGIVHNIIHYNTLSNPGVLNFAIFLNKINSQTLSIENVISNNEITGVPANLISSFSINCGFHVVGGVSNTDFCDNMVDQIRWGFHFKDNNLVRLRENHINHHDYGLYIEGATGPQFGRGNLWDTDPNASTFAARNNNAFPLNSRFLVDSIDEGIVLPWLPPTAKLFPTPNPGMPATYWFHKDDVTLDYCLPSGENPLPRSITQYEKEVVAGTSPLNGAELWNLKLDAYTKLLVYPSLRPSGSPEETFFNGLNNTNLASLALVTQQVRNALGISTVNQTAFGAYRTSIQQTLDALGSLDESIDYSAIANLTDAWFAQRATLLQQVASNAANEAALESARNLLLGTALSSALTTNTNISVTQPYDSAKKTLQDLRIRRLLKQPMTQTLYQQALSLAQQNATTTGYATEEVINFLAPCDQVLYADGDDAPEDRNEEESFTPSFAGIEALQISPNPTSGIAEVSLPSHQSGSLSVYNTDGQLVETLMAAPEMSKISLDLGRAATGLYWVVFKDVTGKIVAAAKISVSH